MKIAEFHLNGAMLLIKGAEDCYMEYKNCHYEKRVVFPDLLN